MDFREADWPADTRLILIRHRVKDKRGRAGGKMLFDCPGYLYQALVTNLPRTVKPLAVWREYNGRAACEGVIKELDAGYGLPQLACQSFWATEAALSLGVLAHNLVVLFERKLGWLEAVTIGSLRYWLFVTAGVLSHPQGRTTIKLAVPIQGKRLVAQALGQTAVAVSQLQCSRKSSADTVAPAARNHPEISFSTAWIRLSGECPLLLTAISLFLRFGVGDGGKPERSGG